MEIIECVKDGLNNNAGAITGIATVVLVGITGYYAHVTKKMLEVNRQMRIDAQKPEVAIRLRCEKTHYEGGSNYKRRVQITRVNLEVENIGGGPAKEVGFTIDPAFKLPGNQSLGEIDFLKHDIAYLPPGLTRECVLGERQMSGFIELMQTQLDIKVSYKDTLKNEYDECRIINFREYENDVW